LLEQKLSLIAALRKLVYLLAAICFLVLLVTGFFPRLVLNKCISGYWLMLHATFAPVFAACLAVLGVLWASKSRFDGRDWPWLQKLIDRVTLVKRNRTQETGGSAGVGQKIAFWLIIVLAVPLILSVVSSMFPILGTYWQEFVLDVHRYTALAFAVVVIIHTYLLIRIKMNE
jgi:cytochrome b subunit of formate dehydrogenase